jgi:hypothetical protein
VNVLKTATFQVQKLEVNFTFFQTFLDYCEDTPGCPQTQSRSWTIPTTSLSNGCPKNETFWNNPVNNIMSYNFGPAPEFTSCQLKRMRCGKDFLSLKIQFGKTISKQTQITSKLQI